MADGCEALLSTLNFFDLKSLAKKFNLDVSQCKLKAEYVKALCSSAEAAKVILADYHDPVKGSLLRKSLLELRVIARNQNIDLSHLKKKWDMVDLLASKESIRSYIEQETRGLPSKQEAPSKAEESQALDENAVKSIISSSLSAEVSFANLEDLLVESTKRLKSGDFHVSVALAKDATLQIRECVKRYLNAVWANAIASAEKILEVSDSSSQAAQDVVQALSQVKRALIRGDLLDSYSFMEELQKRVANLYLRNVDEVKERFASRQKVPDELLAVGADASQTKELLAMAEQALKTSDRSLALHLISKAEEAAEEAKRRRLEEMQTSVASLEGIIREAKSLGGDSAEAEKLLEQTKASLSQGNYMLASELIGRAEKAAMEAQRSQIEKAVELKKRQLEKVKELITRVKSVLDEAQGYGIDVSQALSSLKEAVEFIRRGDYVSGTLAARRAAEITKGLQPLIIDERERRGIVKPKAGVCGSCHSQKIEFYDDGWGRCLNCGANFRWNRAATELHAT